MHIIRKELDNVVILWNTHRVRPSTNTIAGIPDVLVCIIVAGKSLHNYHGHSLKNNKTGGSDGLVGELLKYGGSGMVNLLHQLFSVVWHAELVPPQWREGLIVNLF